MTRLGLSKDTVLEAQMQQRRWERALGTAIRAGQAAGEIATAGGDRAKLTSSVLPSPKDFATDGELHGKSGGAGIYALTDNATDAEFETALSAAHDEGNMSRANVVRKIKEANGTAPANEPTRQHENTR